MSTSGGGRPYVEFETDGAGEVVVVNVGEGDCEIECESWVTWQVLVALAGLGVAFLKFDLPPEIGSTVGRLFFLWHFETVGEYFVWIFLRM